MPTTPETVRAALTHIPANMPRDDWARVLMAVKSEFPDSTGFELVDQWSATDTEGYDPNAVRSTWRSVKASGGVTIGTVLHMAQERGFRLPDAERTALAPDMAELSRQRAQRQAKERAEQLQRTEEQEQAAQSAREMWDEATETGAGDHTYLRRKNVQAHGVRLAGDGTLLVPLRDAAGELWNVQRILAVKPAQGSDKYFQKGGRVSGLWHMIGNPATDVTLIAEGYATAASVHAATGLPVAVAFNAGNLKSVAMALRKAMPTVLIGVCGDDDRATELRSGKNPGADAARIAAARVRGFCVLPHGLPADTSDFNDLHLARGLDVVRAQVEAAIAEHRASRPTTAADAKPRKVERPSTPEPERRQGDPFVVDDTGVYWQGFNREGKPMAPMWLCGRLEVIARTRDADGGGWGYLLRFADPVGRVREWAMPARMLAGDGGELRAALYGMGLSISTSPTARNKLTEYLQTRAPEELAVCTGRTGWHPTAEGGAAYVLPQQTIGDSAERIVFQSDAPMENTFRQRGDVAAWRDRVGALCVGNSRLVLAASAAFAGPLMRPSATDSGGFHLRGDSSSGKTTALRVAASVYGAPGYMQRWRTTDNALEAIAAQHCDGLLILDELAQVDPKTAGECAYLLANEQSKARATRNAVPRPRLTWRLLFLSAGELGLADHMAEAMKRARVGQEVRMVDLAADAGAGTGLFENLHDREGGAALANDLQRATTATYGAAGLAWLEWLAPQWQGLHKVVRERVDALRAAWVPEGASGQVERVGARFALVAVAGELATSAGLTGWPAGEAERGVRVCFESWLSQRGGAGNAEVRQMLRQVRGYLEQHGEGRFTWWHRAADDRNPKTLQRAGVRRMLGADGEPIKTDSQHLAEYGEHMTPTMGEDVTVEYFILPEVFRTEVCKGFDYRAVCAVMLEHGCLQPGKGRSFDCKQRLPGIGNAWCYRVTPTIMELDL